MTAPARRSTLLVVGCGYVGEALAREVGDAWEIWGLRRDANLLPPTITPLAANLLDTRLAQRLPPTRFDYVVFCQAAKTSTEQAYEETYVQGTRRMLRALQERGQTPRRLIFISSTAVYAQARGEWVDETSVAAPENFRGRLLLAAEAEVRRGPWPSCIVRLGGIYGPKRTRLIDNVREQTAPWPAVPHFTNHIHRDDAAGCIAHLLRLPAVEPTYLGVDNEPANQQEILHYVARKLSSAAYAQTAAAPIDRAQIVTGKRCRNDRLQASGYRMRYPTYREGISALLASEHVA